MLKILMIAATIVLVLHGVIHLMGAASYLQLVEIPELPYKTTILNGRWHLGGNGIAIYGVLWAAAATGFVVAGLAFWFGWSGWAPLLVSVTLFSLMLTSLDWSVAYAGVVVNLAILLLIWVGPTMTSAFSG